MSVPLQAQVCQLLPSKCRLSPLEKGGEDIETWSSHVALLFLTALGSQCPQRQLYVTF